MFRRTCTAITALTLLMLPLFAFAAEATCTCFCGVGGKNAAGAQSVGDYTPTDCQALCTSSNKVFVSCATDVEQYPDKNARCFDKTTCENQNGTLDINYQPAECPKNYGFCYKNATKPLALSVAIGTTTSVTDYSQYMTAVYTYGLGIATTIAIVFVMIGGLQYVLAAGTGDTAKAKARIRNAVIGLLLLLFAYTILYTVNPRLVRLQVPSLPMVKRVEIISGAQSCEYLYGEYKAGVLAGHQYNVASGAPKDSPYVGKPYTIDDTDSDAIVGIGAQKCGSISVVKSDSSGTAVAEGTTCQYEACDEQGMLCVGSGKSAECMTCQDVTGTSSISPSTAVCAALTQPDLLSNNPEDPATYQKKNYCFYTIDPALTISTSTLAAAALIPVTGGLSLTAYTALGYTEDQAKTALKGACAEVSLDCSKINKCSDYDQQQATTNGGADDNELEDIRYEGIFANSVNLLTVCGEDPCGAGEKEGGEGGSCVFGTKTVTAFGYDIAQSYDCVAVDSSGKLISGGGTLSTLFEYFID